MKRPQKTAKHDRLETGQPVPSTENTGKIDRSRFVVILIGLLLVAAVVVVTVNLGDLNEFSLQLTRANPEWLGLAFLIQCSSFVVSAIIWRILLERLGHVVSISRLSFLSVAKLFTDQVLPSVGISGSLFFMHALHRRGVKWDKAFVVFALAATTFILAFLIAAAFSIMAVLQFADTRSVLENFSLQHWYIPSLLAGLLVLLAIFLRSVIPRALASRNAAKTISRFLRLAGATVLDSPFHIATIIFLQLVVRCLDAATLWLMFFAIGSDAAYSTCLIAVSIASVAATIAPTPMGLGSFEAGLVSILSLYGVPVESALTTTLLYRGFSLWLPLVPGFFVAQSELLHRRKRAHPNPHPTLSV